MRQFILCNLHFFKRQKKSKKKTFKNIDRNDKIEEFCRRGKNR